MRGWEKLEGKIPIHIPALKAAGDPSWCGGEAEMCGGVKLPSRFTAASGEKEPEQMREGCRSE